MSHRVTIEEFDALIALHLGAHLVAAGFRPAGRRRWVRSRLPQVRDLFELRALKGDAYSPCWGLSLDFVPTVRLPNTLSWHRTDRSALFDLVYDLNNYEPSPARWWVSPSDSGTRSPNRFSAWAKESVAAGEAFFAPIVSLEAVEGGFRAKNQRPFVRFGPDNHLQHRVAHAFVLQRLGHSAEALETLEYFLARFVPMETLAGKLRTLLRAA